uniref:Uncharacterized protein n=1 Tax=Siphoviridae sp. ctVDC13 TaxID=2827880 RepID=A0A8S5TC31_9CAUD|nr:MAG TPA: hypothetical protein [Siphoviridae sp. ctVDC13]
MIQLYRFSFRYDIKQSFPFNLLSGEEENSPLLFLLVFNLCLLFSQQHHNFLVG